MAPRQPIDPPSDPSRKRDDIPRLIAADPVLSVVDRWRAELGVLRRRSPGSDAVATLVGCIDELSAAITAGRNLTVLLTVGEAHHISHIPVSTLRWLCNHKPKVIGAHKRGGVWYIARPQFERYLTSSDVPPAPWRDRAQPARANPTTAEVSPSDPEG
jgi:hypothetical protein